MGAYIWRRSKDARLEGVSPQEIEAHIGAQVERQLERQIRLHLDREDKHLDARFDALERLLSSAFPGGDPDEHRRYHEETMAYMRERRALWRSIREKTLVALIWAALVALGSALWQYFKAKLGGV